MTAKDDLKSVFTLRPSPVRWPIALQAATAIGLPIAVFTAVGQEALGLLASIGGFTALYLSNRSRVQRAAVLPVIALSLLVAAAIGVATAGQVWTSIVGLFVVTAVSSVVFLGFQVGPPGVLFPVLISGVAQHLITTGIDGWVVLGMMAIGSVIAYLVVLAPLVIPRNRKRDRIMARQRFPFELDSQTRIILIRILIGAAIAAGLAVGLGLPRAYWVSLTLVAILQNGHLVSLTAVRGIHRVLGTLVGVGLFALVQLFHPSGWWTVLVLVALQFVVELVVIRNYGLALLFITPLALTISVQGTEPVLDVVHDRVEDTLIGAGIAMVILLVSLGLRWVRARRT
jgi:hypothetical protein